MTIGKRKGYHDVTPNFERHPSGAIHASLTSSSMYGSIWLMFMISVTKKSSIYLNLHSSYYGCNMSMALLRVLFHKVPMGNEG